MLPIIKITVADENAITIPIKSDSNENKYDLCESKICNNLIYAHDCGDEVSDWLSNNLNTRGVRLVKQAKDNTRLKNKNKNEKNENENAVKLSFANQAQFLLINNESVRWLQELIGPDSDINFVSIGCKFSLFHVQILKFIQIQSFALYYYY